MNQKNIARLVSAIFCLVPCMSTATLAADSPAAPPGWFTTGGQPKDYAFGVDPAVTHDGKPTAFIKSVVPKATGFGTMMQKISPQNYAGKRLQFAGWLKTQKVGSFASLWLRIDGDAERMLVFDNMEDRSVKGDSAWEKGSIVLDVPDGAKTINFGVLLNGTGEVWISDLSFKTVGTDVPVTKKNDTHKLELEPQNLDFYSEVTRRSDAWILLIY